MKIITCAISLMLFNSSIAQNKRHIQFINSKTKEAIPFTTVRSILTNYFISTDENGAIEIKLNEKDSILVSSIGYIDKILPVTALKDNNNIELQENYQPLEDVLIGKLKEIEIRQNDFNPDFSFTSTPKNQWAVATRVDFPGNCKKIRLHSIKILIRKTAHKNINPVRLHLYRVDQNGLPGETELLKKDIVLPRLEINRKHLEFQLDDQGITISRSSDSVMYVGIEFLNFSQTEIYDSPEIKITKKNGQQNTVFKNFIINKPSLQLKWVYMSDEEMSVSKTPKAVHPFNMIVSIQAAIVE